MTLQGSGARWYGTRRGTRRCAGASDGRRRRSIRRTCSVMLNDRQRGGMFKQDGEGTAVVLSLAAAQRIAGSLGAPSKMPGASYGTSAFGCKTGNRLAEA